MDAQKYRRMDAYNISEEEYRKLCKQPTAQMIIEAVTRYNELVSQSTLFEGNEVDELLSKAAEEENAKVFLDGIFDIEEKRK